MQRESALERRIFLKSTAASIAAAAASPLFSSNADAALPTPIVELPRADYPRMAWTVDDGCSHDSVKRYIEFVKANDLRLTFFVYSSMGPWTSNMKILRPLVESGQIQLANHSTHHPDLTTLSSEDVQKELMNCHIFMKKNYGVDARPYYRPPYGAINNRVIKAAAELGYTSPVLWSGSFGDAGNVAGPKFMKLANNSMGNKKIVLGHANNLVAYNHYDSLLNILNDRGLTTVTISDAFGV